MRVIRSINPGHLRVIAVALLVGCLAAMLSCSDNPTNSPPARYKWVVLNEGQPIEARKIFFVDERNGWAVADLMFGTIHYYRTRDGGRTWEPKTVPSHPDFYGNFMDGTFTDTLNGWFVGDDGLICHTTDGGKSWTWDDRLKDPVHRGLPLIMRVLFPDSLHGWLWIRGWQSESIGRTTDGGRTWQTMEWTGELLQALNGNVAFANQVILGTIRTVDGGATWQPIFPPGGGASVVSFISENEGWAISNFDEVDIPHHTITVVGQLLSTRNGGATWDTMYTIRDGEFQEIHMNPNREGWVIGSPNSSLNPLLHTLDGITWAVDSLPEIAGRKWYDNLFVLPGPHVWIMAQVEAGECVVLKREEY